MELVNCNVVVAARQFNPSILTQLWLVRNQVVQEEEFEANNNIFLDVLSQSQTGQFTLVVVPDLLSFVIKPGIDPNAEGALVAERIGRIAHALPHTPYVALGLNFVWHETPQNESISDLTRRLFFRQNAMPYSRFDVPDAGFGCYMSKGFHNFRLKMDVKPVTLVPTPDTREDKLQFAFNFHRDLAGDGAVADIEQSLLLWDDAKRESREIATGTLRGGD